MVDEDVTDLCQARSHYGVLRQARRRLIAWSQG